MAETMKKEILDFLMTEKPNPEKGAALMQKYGTNKTEVSVFMASPTRYVMQMRWSLAKLLGITLIDFQKGYFTDIRKTDESEWPPVITRIKEALPILFNQQAELQKELGELGDGNDEATVAKAKELGEIIDELAVRHQLLGEAKEAYFNSEGKLVPDEEELFPPLDGEGSQALEPKVKYTVLEEGDPVEILKRKKNLESYTTKHRNLLLFQSKSKPKDEKENPMPQGPDRDKVEAKLQEFEGELEAINAYLESKDNATPAE